MNIYSLYSEVPAAANCAKVVQSQKSINNMRVADVELR